jgi:hypothetical protein
MRELIALIALYGAALLTFRRLGGLAAAGTVIEDWGRRTTSV